jgi:hypothetical protein
MSEIAVPAAGACSATLAVPAQPHHSLSFSLASLAFSLA